ncbi:hypothetical protein [Pseudomonas laurylsulfatiphila]|uniref:hypothetical protein n=1 Tax=Pseudomonas laurylsulfatiphila TaxID=2011015 RepID=UPI003D1BE387
MLQAILIKVVLQFGSTVLLNLLHAAVDALQVRKDNDLDIGAETVKMILKGVTIDKK